MQILIGKYRIYRFINIKKNCVSCWISSFSPLQFPYLPNYSPKVLLGFDLAFIYFLQPSSVAPQYSLFPTLLGWLLFFTCRDISLEQPPTSTQTSRYLSYSNSEIIALAFVVFVYKRVFVFLHQMCHSWLDRHQILESTRETDWVNFEMIWGWTKKNWQKWDSNQETSTPFWTDIDKRFNFRIIFIIWFLFDKGEENVVKMEEFIEDTAVLASYRHLMNNLDAKSHCKLLSLSF